MLSLNAILFLALAASLPVLALPQPQTTTLKPGWETYNRSFTEHGDEFYTYYWTDGGSKNASFSKGPAGQFSMEWETGGNVLGGKGWSPGSFASNISYAANFNYTGNCYLGIFGFTDAPYTEYFVIENHGTYNPCGYNPIQGTFEADGSLYDICEYRRIPIGLHDPMIRYSYSVRRNKRSIGTVNLQLHYDAWTAAKHTFGTVHAATIVAVDGYFSTGRVSVEVLRKGKNFGTK